MEARKQATALLSKFGAESIAAAAATTGVSFGMGLRIKRVADEYPDAETLARAVLKGDKALKKKDLDTVKASAIALLAELDEAAALPFALALVDDEGPWSKMACEALAVSRRDEALDKLFATAALPSSAKVKAWAHAGGALPRSRHPEVAARALAMLQSAHAAKGRIPIHLLDILGERQYEPARAVLQAVTQDCEEQIVREFAAFALGKFSDPKALDEAAKNIEDANSDLRRVAIDAVFQRDPARAFDRLGKYLDSDNPTAETLLIVLLIDVDGAKPRGWFAADPRWRAHLHRMVDAHDRVGFWTAWSVLAAAGDVRADVMIAMLGDAPYGTRYAQCLFKLPPSALPALEAEHARRTGGDKGTLNNVIKHIRSKVA